MTNLIITKEPEEITAADFRAYFEGSDWLMLPEEAHEMAQTFAKGLMRLPEHKRLAILVQLADEDGSFTKNGYRK